ncbi:MAG: spherulation-specific family 4 protein [Pseudomonadota bacterium]|nr:spherulation-specific family 4 protein [Pseudomonadota bacterium]
MYTPHLARRTPLGIATLTLFLATVVGAGASTGGAPGGGTAAEGGGSTGASGYVGCFKDTGERDLDGHLEFTQTNSPETCIETCLDLGFAYAGVQWGQACLCGDSYGRYGPATNCDMTCTGDPAETCGGFAANEVWTTGKSEARPQPSGSTGTACSQIAIPSYFYPGSLWDQAVSGAPKVGILIANPDSGPGGSVDPEYVSAVTKAKAAGVRVIGYVYTSYGNRSAAEVKADIEKYKSWYQVDGIFLDEVSDQAGLIPYYQDVADYVRAGQGSLVMLNPGVYPDEGYMNVGDIVVVFEDDYSVYLNATVPSWASNYPPSKFSHLVYAAPDGAALDRAASLAGQRNAGYIYVTSDILPNPWDELPSYWSSELALACSSPTTTGGGPTAPAPTEPPARGYIGCFKDTGDRDLNGYLEFTQTNSPEACIETCLDLGFAYAGVQWGQACLCGDSYGKYGPATNCDMTCTGDPAETCGGFAANGVWATGKK